MNDGGEDAIAEALQQVLEASDEEMEMTPASHSKYGGKRPPGTTNRKLEASSSKTETVSASAPSPFAHDINLPQVEPVLKGKKGTILKGAALKAAIKKRKSSSLEDMGSDGDDSIASSQTTAKSDVSTKPGTPPKRSRVGLKKGESVGSPRPPTAHLSSYNTAKYNLYSSAAPNPGAPVTGTFRTFGAYDDYALVSDRSIKRNNFAEMVPTEGVRLDDRLVGIALQTSSTAKQLSTNWPAEFDKAGMVRATRVPLGNACKVRVNMGDSDIDGNVCDSPGSYYGWWRGIHCLMGKEGADAGLYTIRPSHEAFKCEGMGWKFGFKAVVQPIPKVTASGSQEGGAEQSEQGITA